MCGIAGVALSDSSRPASRDLAERMAAALQHRGPDSRGVHSGPGIGLGVQRLAIVDLATGDQPIGNEDGSILVICNGEIYNHVALREGLEARGHRFRTRSDVEVIVHLYEEEGVESVSGCAGCSPSRSGTRGAGGSGSRGTGSGSSRSTTPTPPRVSTSRRSRRPSSRPASSPDPSTCARSTSSSCSASFWCRAPCFAGSAGCPRATGSSTRVGARSSSRTGGLAEVLGGPRHARRAEDWAEALHAKLAETVALHARADVRIGAWLSGGLDSSAVAALASPDCRTASLLHPRLRDARVR